MQVLSKGVLAVTANQLQFYSRGGLPLDLIKYAI